MVSGWGRVGIIQKFLSFLFWLWRQEQALVGAFLRFFLLVFLAAGPSSSGLQFLRKKTRDLPPCLPGPWGPWLVSSLESCYLCHV